jgi:hypothetical protein
MILSKPFHAQLVGVDSIRANLPANFASGIHRRVNICISASRDYVTKYGREISCRKSRKSKRFVGITERVRAALLARKPEANEGWVFPSPRAKSGHLQTVQKQFERVKRLRLPVAAYFDLLGPISH